MLRLVSSKNILHSAQILLGIHSDRIVGSFGNVDRNSVLQEAQLLEALAVFQRRLRQRAETIERRLAIGVKA